MAELSQGIYYLVGRSPLRVVVLPGLDAASGSAARLAAMRPTPSMHVLMSAGSELDALTAKAARAGLVGKYTRWMLVDTAVATGLRDASLLNNSTIPVTLLTPRASLCCSLRGEDADEGPCTCPQPRRLHEMLLPAIADLLQELAAAARARGVAMASGEKQVACGEDDTGAEPAAGSDAPSPVLELLQQVR